MVLDYLQLISSDGVGPITFYKLVEQFGSVKNALENLPAKYKKFDRKLAENQIKQAKKLGVKIIAFDDELYPKNLKHIADAPPILFVKGDEKLLNAKNNIAVVGGRNASINSRKFASRISYELSNCGVVITSGMARGIDTSAHRGAMHAMETKAPTIAVLGTGVDVVYPKENVELYNKIIEQGCVVSEFLLGEGPNQSNFPRRNRIVAGLATGTLVVEATLNSGSLITARLANEFGRDVFAVPGSPSDARSLGTNKLIKDGAILVDEAEDVLSHLQLEMPEKKQVVVDNNKKIVNITTNNNILDFIDASGVYVDELIRVTGLDVETVELELMELELSGVVERQSGNKVVLIGRRK
ncbi:MAG: DNA-processing protein DprA [Alphaproteobacteria bacterium]